MKYGHSNELPLSLTLISLSASMVSCLVVYNSVRHPTELCAHQVSSDDNILFVTPPHTQTNVEHICDQMKM